MDELAEREDTDSDATTCDPDWLQDMSADIDVVPDTQYMQYSNRPHPPTSTQLAPPTYPHKSESSSCKEELLPELPLPNGDARDGSRIDGGLPLAVAGGHNECKMDWNGVNRKEANLSLVSEEGAVEVGESATAEMRVARRGRDTEVKHDDSDYCSVAEMEISRHEKSSLLCEEESPLQKDMGFDEPLFERPRFPHSPTNSRRPFLLSPPGVTPTVEIPATVNQYLRDYQQRGVQFLFRHYSRNAGGVLCDDMGLGKTVQVIAFMCAVLGKTCTKADVMLTNPRQTCGRGCFLVVCPSSVLYNWTSEIDTWSHLKYGVYHRGRKSEVLDKVRRHKLDVVLTTHDTTRAHVEELNTIDWLSVICDEVQAIKGTTSQVTTAMNSLRATRRFGLTGTALQNNLTELWSILNWANPGCLDTLSSFHDNIERPILEGQKFDCTKRQLAQGRRKLSELEELMEGCVLRRTKALIASQLPKKEEFVMFCPVTELQETIYRAILDCEDMQLILRSGEPCDCYSGNKRGKCCYRMNTEGVEWQHLINEYSCLLTKCANHLGLLLPDKTPSNRQRKKADRACQEVFSKHPIFTEMSKQASLLTLSDPQYCGKMRVLEKLLVKFQEEKSKVIIFSISVKLLDMVENYLVSKGYVYCRLDGSTKIEERASLVRSFNMDPTQFVFLISKKCGGVGLNVTGANRVIIFDPSWNPATELQAEDRAFRIGQSRNVKVYRFISEGTVEENIYLRQVYKQQLANMTMEGSRERRYFSAVAGDRSQQGELFGYANLFQMRRPGSNLALDILKRADKMEAGVRVATDQLHGGEESEVKQKQVCGSKENTILQGATTLVHSGGRSVVGNSRVEEHISKQALADVYELQQHSQDPANVVANKLEDFSDESDDVDYQPPPRTLSSTTEKQALQEEAGPSTPRVAEPSSKDDVEGKERKLLRHEHFGRMVKKFGYSSQHEFALHVRDAGREERQRLLREFYGGTQAVEGKGKRRVTAAKAPPAKRTRKLPESVTRKPGRRRKRKPALEFEDSSSPPPPPLSLPQEACENPETEEKFPEGVESPEVRVHTTLASPIPSRLPSLASPIPSRLPSLASPIPSRLPSLASPIPSRLPSLASPISSRLPSLASPIPSRLPSLASPIPSRLPSLASPIPSRLPSATCTSTDHNNIHEEQLSPSMFGTLTEGSPNAGRNCPTHCSSIDELFEEVGYHGNLEVATTLSKKVQTKNDSGLKSLPSINIDELFGI